MKHQVLFALKKTLKKYSRLPSAAVEIGAIRVKYILQTNGLPYLNSSFQVFNICSFSVQQLRHDESEIKYFKASKLALDQYDTCMALQITCILISACFLRSLVFLV